MLQGLIGGVFEGFWWRDFICVWYTNSISRFGVSVCYSVVFGGVVWYGRAAGVSSLLYAGVRVGAIDARMVGLGKCWAYKRWRFLTARLMVQINK